MQVGRGFLISVHMGFMEAAPPKTRLSDAQELEPEKCDIDYTANIRRIFTSAAHISFVQPITTTDTQCQSILQRHAAGSLTSDIARRLIAEELHRSNIVQEVVEERRMATSAQLRRDIAAEMQTLLFQKVIQETPGGFDLTATGSTTGWARQLLRAARASIVRNILARSTQRLDLIDPMPPLPNETVEHKSHTLAYTIFHSAEASTPSAEMEGNKKDLAAEWLRSKTRHLRDNSRLAAQAATIMYGYSVPQLVRPRLDERRRLKQIIDADPSLARRSVRHMRAIIEGELSSDHTIDTGLQALWDDYSSENLNSIARADAKVALALVDNALTDRPRPSRGVVRAFRAAVKAMGTGKGWLKLAEECCDAFIALECEAYSSFDSTAQKFRDERESGRILACQKAPRVFERVTQYPGQRLGIDHDEIYSQMDRLLSNLTDMDIEEKAAA